MNRLAAEMHSVTKGDLERLLESVHRSIVTEEAVEQPNLSGLDEGLESYLLSEYSRTQPKNIRKIAAIATPGPAPRASLNMGGAVTVMQVQLSSRVFDWSRLDEWGVDPYLYSDEELVDILLGMVERLNLIATCHLRPAKLAKFLQTVRSYYHVENAYHNFKHAFCVAHMIYLALFRFNFRSHFSEEEVLGIFIAALCHDVDHPGHSNQFEINSKSELALMYSHPRRAFRAWLMPFRRFLESCQGAALRSHHGHCEGLLQVQ
jgi:hypothetical protein